MRCQRPLSVVRKELHQLLKNEYARDAMNPAAVQAKYHRLAVGKLGIDVLAGGVVSFQDPLLSLTAGAVWPKV